MPKLWDLAESTQPVLRDVPQEIYDAWITQTDRFQPYSATPPTAAAVPEPEQPAPAPIAPHLDAQQPMEIPAPPIDTTSA